MTRPVAVGIRTLVYSSQYKWMPGLLLLFAWLPSLLLLWTPIYDADTTAFCFGGETNRLQLYGTSGRPLMAFILEPFIRSCAALQYPRGAMVFMLFFIANYGLWLCITHLFLCRAFGSSMLSAVLLAAVSFHFHSYEMRTWCSTVYLASIIATLGLWLGWRSPVRRQKTPRAVMLCAVGLLLALNVHQSGAFIVLPLLAIASATRLLRLGAIRIASFRREFTLLGGIGIALLLYAVELAVIKHLYGFVARDFSPQRMQNFLVFLKRLPAWATALLPLPFIVRQYWFVFVPATVFIIVIAWKASPQPNPLRKWTALALLVACSIASAAPSIISVNTFPSRVLAPVLLGLWSLPLLMLGLNRANRRSGTLATITLLSLAGMFVVHIWGFALNIAVKKDAGKVAFELRNQLKAAGADKESKITAYAPPYFVRDVYWSDAGTTLMSSSWGVQSILAPRVFTDSFDIGQQLINYSIDKRPPIAFAQPALQAMIRRNGTHDFLVNGGTWNARAMQIADSYRAPFRDEWRLSLAELAAYCSLETSATIDTRWTTPDEFVVFLPGVNGKVQLSLAGLPIAGRDWRLSFSTGLGGEATGALPARLYHLTTNGPNEIASFSIPGFIEGPMKDIRLRGTGGDGLALEFECDAKPKSVLFLNGALLISKTKSKEGAE